jgi:hypothetical protein
VAYNSQTAKNNIKLLTEHENVTHKVSLFVKKGAPKLPNMTSTPDIYLCIISLDYSNSWFVMEGMRTIKALIEINFKI